MNDDSDEKPDYKDLAEKPDLRYYDVDSDAYKEGISKEHKKFKTQLSDSHQVEVEVEPKQVVEVMFDTKLRK